jgi:hypothetical protein
LAGVLPGEGIAITAATGERHVSLVALDGRAVDDRVGLEVSYVLNAPGATQQFTPGPIIVSGDKGSFLLAGGSSELRATVDLPIATGADLNPTTGVVSRGGIVISSGWERAVLSAHRDLLSRQGRVFDLHSDTEAQIPSTCEVGDRDGPEWFLLCGLFDSPGTARIVLRHPDGSMQDLVPLPSGPDIQGRTIGFWRGVVLSPDRSTLLLQYSGNCEVPLVFTASRSGGAPTGLMEPNPEAVALGWASDGRAVVQLPSIGCGDGSPRPGVYLVTAAGRQTLVTAITDTARAYLWSPSTP